LSTTGKEYKLAIRIAGIIDKSFNVSLTSAKGSLAKFKATINAMDKDFKKLDEGFNGIMKTGKKCFSAIATAAGVAAVAVGAATAASIAVGSEFESAFTGVKKTVDATEEEYAKLRQDILDMTRTIPSSASDIAGVMEIAGQLGIATDSLTDFTETMINLGVSTNLSAEDAATNLAKFANVVSMADYDENGISNWERLGSVIVDLGNNFATTEADIVEMGTRLASTGTLVGLTESQIMALSTAMSSVGIQAESGGSTMAKLLKKMQLAVELNSDALTDYASVANMTGEQFAQAFQDDAVVALSAFIDGLNDTERNGKSAIAILDDMGLSEVRLSNTILALAGADGVMSSAIETANKAWEENTALTIEAGKRYETAESKVQLMKNAFSELGITAYEELREPFVDVVDTITQKVISLNDYVGSANGISKWIKNINTTLPTLKRQAKNAWKSVSPLFDGIKNTGEWCIEHKDGVVGFIQGIGAALVAYKIASTLVHIVNALMSFASMNPVTIGIMAAVAAIGLLVAAIQSYKNHEKTLVNENLAKHFGNIALSMEEIQGIAEHIVSSDSLGGVKEALEAFEDLDSISATMEDSISELNKMNWKVSIGMELTADEQESYKEAIDEYVKAAEDYALQSQYAVSLNLSTVFDNDNPDEKNIADKVNAFYSDCYSEMTNLGKELSQTVNEAFSDNILDPDEIASISEIQAKMAELQEKLATGEFDAQLSLLKTEYTAGSLDADSFQNLQEELAEQAETAAEAYKESFVKNLASINATYEGGGLTDQEYQDAQDTLMGDYLKQVGEIQAKTMNFQLETIMEQYADEFDPAMEDYISHIQEIIDKYKDWDWENDWEGGWNAMKPELFDAEHTEELDKTTREAIQQLLDAMQPTVEQMEELKQQYADLGIDITDSMSEALSDYNILAVLADNAGKWTSDGISDGVDGAYIVGQEMAKAGLWDSLYEGIMSEAEGSGYIALFDTYKQGALDAAASVAQSDITAAAENTVKPAVEGMYAWSQEAIDEYYSKGFTASADVSITLNPLYNWSNTSLPALSGLSALSGSNYTSKLDIKHNASGGIWDKPILTTFAENSPEAAIPLDGSQNAINLWEQTGKLLGMDSVLDNVSLEGGNGPVIEYSPVLKFYGEAPSKDDISEALSISKDEFENLMARYMKDNGRVSFA
jgi:TP901 family phage tail tape measure protein